MYDVILRRAATASVGIAAIGLATAANIAAAATFTVNRTGDTAGSCGTTCNIRQAIDAANLTTARDTILFNIPACGTRQINILGGTLHVKHPVTIDGHSQPLCGDPIPGDRTSMIELRGPGVTVMPNGTILHGIVLDAGSDGSDIKGLAINGFSGNGIGVASDSNFIFNCKLGTDATGRQSRPNNIGITIADGTTDNDVRDNLISANQTVGIQVLGDATLITDNTIGLSIDGDSLGNGTDGIHTFGANDTKIGVMPAIGNTIAANGGTGISIGIGSFNTVTGNRISNNGGLGVRLVGTGANHAQASPVVTSVAHNFQVISTSPFRVQIVTRIKGTLTNAPGASFSVDLYSNDACDPSGAGEGQVPVTNATVTNGAFDVTTTADPQSFITAIARSPDGDTSQFSNCAAVPPL